MSAPEVWITGLGAVTAVGRGTPPLLAALRAGRSGVGPVPELGGAPAGRVDVPARQADPAAAAGAGKRAEGIGEPAKAAAPERTRRLDRSGTHFFQAAEEAWRDAGLAAAPADPTRIGLCEGSSLGTLAAVLESAADRDAHGRTRVRRSGLVRCMTGAGGATFAQAHGLDGPVIHVSAACVSAAGAIGEAFHWILHGRADVVVTGGGECPLHPLLIEHFLAAGVLSPFEGGAQAGAAGAIVPCRPFDAERSGTVFGEGAGALVLESSEHARQRGAAPVARLLGYGFSCEGYSIVAPDPEGTAVSEAVHRALAGATSLPGWIRCHATATRAGDAAECRGLARIFGADFRAIPLTGLKPIVGHCLGASGAVEAVAAILALREGIVPPTLGTSRLDPELPPCTVATETRRTQAKEVLMVSEGFGGRCAALRVAAA